MEDIVEQKGIEKIEVSEPKVEEIVEKKRKPRSEAQKAAFEKARLKRAENLAKNKLEEQEGVTIDERKIVFYPPPLKRFQIRPQPPLRKEVDQRVVGNSRENLCRSWGNPTSCLRIYHPKQGILDINISNPILINLIL